MKKTIISIIILTSLSYSQKTIHIDLSKQRAYAMENGKAVFSGRVSTGKKGKRTPKGTFTVLYKKRKHKSSKYPKPNGGAPMNYMIRITNYGIAMHVGRVPNYPASHGCIRMGRSFAKKMYKWAEKGIQVKIYGNPNKFRKKYARK